jgi:hypothetical protein
MLHRVAQGGGGIQRREHTGAGRLDVGFKALDPLLGFRVRFTRVRERLRRGLTRTHGFSRGLDAPGHGQPCRLAPCLQIAELAGNLSGPARQRLGLVAVEFLLLLPAIDVELPRVGILANARGAAIRFRLLDAQTGEVRFAFGDARGGRRLAGARLREPRARRVNRPRQLAVAAGKEYLLPAPELFAQLPVSACLRGLPLERAPLLLDLEDDVIDPGEVLLRRLELHFGGATARLVFRDPRRLLDQLAPIRRPRAQDHADLALFDDRVRLGPEAGVHQQLVHVAEPAYFPVDQVFALSGAIQAPRHLDVTREEIRRGVMTIPVAIPVGGVKFERIRAGVLRRRVQAGQAQPHLGGCAGLARIAAAEDDVLHPVATQALRALLTEHPGDGVRHVALAAPVGADDGGDAMVEGQLRAVGERLEAVDLETF